MIAILAISLSIAFALMAGVAVGIFFGRRQAAAPRINSEYFDLLWTALTATFIAFVPLLFLGTYCLMSVLYSYVPSDGTIKTSLVTFGSLFSVNSVFAVIAAPVTVASYFYFKPRTRKAPTP